MAMPEIQFKACHNCRRHRRKCDRNVPTCLKCIQRGQECLGYQKLLRWGQGLASRGKLRGITFETLAGKSQHPRCQRLQLPGHIADPLLQDLSSTSRRHLAYYATHVCRDLVLYDVPYVNPFGELIPLSGQYASLQQIIIAVSALHMSNALEGLCPAPLQDLIYGHYQSGHRSSDSQPSQKASRNFALASKQQALRLLNGALGTMGMQDLDAILATVLLFVQFEIMYSGQDEWRYHIRGARALIAMVYESGFNAGETMSDLRRCLISNCLVYDIFGSTFTSFTDLAPNDLIFNKALSLLQDNEGNHCSSFPLPLLQVVREASRLWSILAASDTPAACVARENQMRLLLESARCFDPYAWAIAVQARSPLPDLAMRTHIAFAHRAATCIYLQRVAMAGLPDRQISQDVDTLVFEIQTHLLNISPGHPLVAATAWPTFIAGAEARNRVTEDWAQSQFQEIWAAQPWGLIRGALAVLRSIWASRKRNEEDEHANRQFDEEGQGDWISYMRTKGVDWLIV